MMQLKQLIIAIKLYRNILNIQQHHIKKSFQPKFRRILPDASH